MLQASRSRKHVNRQTVHDFRFGSNRLEPSLFLSGSDLAYSSSVEGVFWLPLMSSKPQQLTPFGYALAGALGGVFSNA
jgi:hypothetical protein